MEEITRGQNDQQVSGLSESEAARRQKQHKEPTVKNEDEQSAPAMEETDIDPLDLYLFEITGKILTRCDTCRKRTTFTEQQFWRALFLQRTLIGAQKTCAFCYTTGNVRVYGVTAVLNTLDEASKSESACAGEPRTSAEKRENDGLMLIVSLLLSRYPLLYRRERRQASHTSIKTSTTS